MIFLIRIKVDIEVKNHEEIIRANKGAFLSSVASLLGGAENKVEEEVRKQVKIALQKSIKEQLIKNGVKAEVSVY